MRILFLNRSYWPDVEATGQLLTELCSDLAKTHDVTVIAGQPNFVQGEWSPRWVEESAHQGVQILRVASRRFRKSSLLSRIIGLSSYLLLAAWTAFTVRRPDIIVAETDPPVLGALGAVLKVWHRAKFIYYLQDLYPEVALATGKLRPGLLTWFLMQMTQLGLKRADRIIVLGADMREKVGRRGIPSGKMAIIPNWADTKKLVPVTREESFRKDWGLEKTFVVMYSGNLGLSQNLEILVDAAAMLEGEDVTLVFVGEGAAKEGLQKRVNQSGLGNVRFLPYQPKDELAKSLSTADVHVITMQQGVAGYLVPSKLYGILAVGKPYIASVEPESEVGRITLENKTGYVIATGSAEALAQQIRYCQKYRQESQEMGERGRELALREFDRSAATGRFAKLVAEFKCGN